MYTSSLLTQKRYVISIESSEEFENSINYEQEERNDKKIPTFVCDGKEQNIFDAWQTTREKNNKGACEYNFTDKES
ncbi:unnamed protein product [Rotaria magnacalcarata]|uniref:Uncharacterized protein n=1 Tax=Rotaria magnacalcarata TaxID=392030 RepID=A0A8S3IHP6_9BILA|nr:unnamed protein product [Rotaria magnacalcarata]CAF5201064.1 unnamed protein product [Rotaria magnacalcarata]